MRGDGGRFGGMRDRGTNGGRQCVFCDSISADGYLGRRFIGLFMACMVVFFECSSGGWNIYDDFLFERIDDIGIIGL